MKRYYIICVLVIAFLSAVITAKADDDVTVKRNENGTWTFVKPAGVDVKIKVVYFTKEELDAMAAKAVESVADSLVNINTDAEEIPLKDFSFDELSRSIAAELDRLKEEKKSQVKVEEKEEESKDYEVINPFNDESIFKPFKVSNIEDMINEENKEEPKEEKATFKVTEDIFKKDESSEPVLKDEETPLFARFNQETYDISNKD